MSTQLEDSDTHNDTWARIAGVAAIACFFSSMLVVMIGSFIDHPAVETTKRVFSIMLGIFAFFFLVRTFFRSDKY